MLQEKLEVWGGALVLLLGLLFVFFFKKNKVLSNFPVLKAKSD